VAHHLRIKNYYTVRYGNLRNIVVENVADYHKLGFLNLHTPKNGRNKIVLGTKVRLTLQKRGRSKRLVKCELKIHFGKDESQKNINVFEVLLRIEIGEPQFLRETAINVLVAIRSDDGAKQKRDK